jgi:hypothetical protein
MTMFRTPSMLILSTLVVLVLLVVQPSNAFVRSSVIATAFTNNNNSIDSTSTSLYGFLEDGKKALVKSMAGEYDPIRIKARMDTIIATNKVVMLSFTTCPFWYVGEKGKKTKQCFKYKPD